MRPVHVVVGAATFAAIGAGACALLALGHPDKMLLMSGVGAAWGLVLYYATWKLALRDDSGPTSRR